MRDITVNPAINQAGFETVLEKQVTMNNNDR